LNKKVILIFSLIASGVLLTSMWITFVQSAKDVQIPTEWYQTVPSIITSEQWSWDWSVYTIPAPGGPPFFFYKKVGDSIFVTFLNGPMMVADRVGQSLTWEYRGAFNVMGGPMATHLLMMNATLSITFTNEDIPLTDEDNDYRGLRLLVEHWGDLYGLENVGGDNYLWRGGVHQHFVSWAPKGSRA
jgi:hypothetical protein